MALYDVIMPTVDATGSTTRNVRYDGTIYAVPIPFENSQVLSIVAENLATTEVVNIYTWGGTKWTPVARDEVAVQLTADSKSDAFNLGLEFGVSKSITAAACGVRYGYAPRQY